MDSKTSEDVVAALSRLNAQIESKEITIFSETEAQSLKRVAAFWCQLEAVASLGATAGGVFRWVVGLGIAYVAFKAGVLEWLKAGMGK